MPEAVQSGTPVDATDPRVLRSRRMLMDALARLLSKKEFDEISIQEIAQEATLNRATFYLHYPDKQALLEAMTDLRFRSLIERRGISFTDCDGALRGIALGVCDYLAETTQCPVQGSKVPLERSIIPVVEGFFKEGLSLHATAPDPDVSLAAITAAWAVFGAARRWYETPNRISAEEMATKIEALVRPILLGVSSLS